MVKKKDLAKKIAPLVRAKIEAHTHQSVVALCGGLASRLAKTMDVKDIREWLDALETGAILPANKEVHKAQIERVRGLMHRRAEMWSDAGRLDMISELTLNLAQRMSDQELAEWIARLKAGA